MEKATVKERVVHEVREFLFVVLLLAPFLVSFATYRMFLTDSFGSWLFQYGTSLVNALILAKVILIVDLARLGKLSEHSPAIVHTFHKSLVFSVFAVLFHLLETVLRDMFNGLGFRQIVAGVGSERGELATRALFLFFAFIPFCALLELRRVIGAEKFLQIFWKAPPAIGNPVHEGLSLSSPAATKPV